MQKIILGIFIVFSSVLYAQDYHYSASISGVKTNAFYKIFLAPEISSKLNPNCTDIRLYDNGNIEIPALFEKENPINESLLFKEYEIIEQTHYKGRSYTRIVIHNPTKNQIDNIVLRIKNAEVRKRLKLNASNDNKMWYVLKDNYYYNSIPSTQNTSEIRVLNFPLSDYEYYELLISDYYDKPINIVQAGYYDLVKELGKYTEVAPISYTKTDTQKETIFKIPLHNHYIDKISFKINQPKYYKRSVEFYVHNTVVNRERKQIYDKHILTANLISNSSNSFKFNNLQADTLFIRIKNNDDQALGIEKVLFYQLNKYIIAELNTTNTYHINFSDKNAQKPIYDLSYFADKIPLDIKVIDVKDIRKIGKENTPEIDNINFSNYWMWIIIVGLGTLLAYMSFSMIRKSK